MPAAVRARIVMGFANGRQRESEDLSDLSACARLPDDAAGRIGRLLYIHFGGV